MVDELRERSVIHGFVTTPIALPAKLSVATAISQGLVVDPIELRAHNLPQSWQLLSIHAGGRTFVFLGIVESFVVLALLAAAAVVLRPRLARGQTRT